MKILEHLEHVIGLLDRNAPNSDIKLALLAMHEQLAGYDQTLSDQIALTKNNADSLAEIQKENAKLKQQLLQQSSRPKEIARGEEGGWTA